MTQRAVKKIGEIRALENGSGLRFECLDPDDCNASINGFAISHVGRVFAYANRCPHLGVELDWTPGEFFNPDNSHLICSTHGALFEPDTGRCVSGPCTGQSLTPVPVIERSGELFLSEEQAPTS